MSELTEQQAIFVREYVRNGGNGAEAARAAGYSEVSAGKYAYQLLEKPHVADALRAEQKRALGGKLSTMALAVLEGILANDKAPFGVRVDAAKAVLDRGGLNPPKAAPADEQEDEKPLAELPIEKLEAIVYRLEKGTATEGADPKAAA